MIIQIDNAGFAEQVSVSQRELSRVHRPVLERLRDTGGQRCIAALGGPPGCGKGVLVEVWRLLADKMNLSFVAVSLDGFHYPNAVLEGRGLLDRKGAPETFDVRSMTIALAQAREGTRVVWPKYDRNLHEPVSDGTPIEDQKVVVLEGNYLLLDEPHWASARRYADITVGIKVDRDVLKERIVARHVRGGTDRTAAERKFSDSDFKNILRVEEGSVAPDLILMQGANGEYRLMMGGGRTL